jgi:hypothetical protein
LTISISSVKVKKQTSLLRREARRRRRERAKGVWWLMPQIPATWGVEIEGLGVQDQPRHKVSETPISTNKWMCWNVPTTEA